VTPKQLITCLAIASAFGLGAEAPFATGTPLRAPALVSGPRVDSHPDPAGDANNSADISRIDVGNDYVSGAYVIWVNLGNRPTLQAEDGLALPINSDLNPATGDTQTGADFEIDLHPPNNCSLFRLQGEDSQQVPAASLRCDFANGVARIEIQPTELGDSRSIDFFAFTVSGKTAGDEAPDGDVWISYTSRAGKVPLSVAGFTLVPNAPKAGRGFVATMAVNRDDILARIDSGAVTCTLKTGSSLSRTSGDFVGGRAVCRVRLPGAAKGQPFRLSMTVSFRGSTVTKTVSGRVN